MFVQSPRLPALLGLRSQAVSDRLLYIVENNGASGIAMMRVVLRAEIIEHSDGQNICE